jgi:hypothetical protein
MISRWVLAKAGRAHLDLGERSAQSLRVKSEHVIVTACQAHIQADAPIMPPDYQKRCSNCVRISLSAEAARRLAKIVTAALTANSFAYTIQDMLQNA